MAARNGWLDRRADFYDPISGLAVTRIYPVKMAATRYRSMSYDLLVLSYWGG